MSNTIVLERPTVQAGTSLADRFISPAEEEHTRKIAKNFQKLRFDSAADYNSAREGEPVASDVAVMAPPEEETSSAAQRFADYTPVEAPATHRDLFGGFVFRIGKLETPADVAAPAPSAEAAQVPVTAAAPAPITAEEEDAIPTRRTMDTLNHPAMQTGEVSAQSAMRVSAAIATRMKVALVAVVSAIVLAIVLICINSGLIRSANAEILDRQAELTELTRATQIVKDRIAELTSPENIAEWAARNNMVLGD